MTRRSGSSIRGDFSARAGNKRLKDAMLFSAWVASNYDPESRAYYQRKRAEGKKHNAAIMCLALIFHGVAVAGLAASLPRDGSDCVIGV